MAGDGDGSSGKKGGMSLGVQVIIGTVLSIIAAFIGGALAEYLEAPFYFGFIFTVVLVGMIVMFILAANLARGKE